MAFPNSLSLPSPMAPPACQGQALILSYHRCHGKCQLLVLGNPFGMHRGFIRVDSAASLLAGFNHPPREDQDIAVGGKVRHPLSVLPPKMPDDCLLSMWLCLHLLHEISCSVRPTEMPPAAGHSCQPLVAGGGKFIAEGSCKFSATRGVPAC